MDAYEAWERDCLAEWNRRYGEKRVLGVNGPNCIEFSEDGDAYPHGIGGTNWVARAVTPWRESPHYMDWRRAG